MILKLVNKFPMLSEWQYLKMLYNDIYLKNLYKLFIPLFIYVDKCVSLKVLDN